MQALFNNRDFFACQAVKGIDKLVDLGLQGRNIRRGEVVGVFEAFVPEPEDVQTGLVTVRSELEESECPLFSSFSRSIVCLKSQERT